MKIKNFAKLFGNKQSILEPKPANKSSSSPYKPTPYLATALLQSVYNIS